MVICSFLGGYFLRVDLVTRNQERKIICHEIGDASGFGICGQSFLGGRDAKGISAKSRHAFHVVK